MRSAPRWPGQIADEATGVRLDAEFGRLDVPERHDDPTGPSLQLSFVRVPARRATTLPPLVMLAGGPGGAAIQPFASYRLPWVRAMSEVCDVVTFDQRGCHTALPRLDNPFALDVDLGEVLTRDRYIELSRRNAARVAEYWHGRGVDLDAYNTIESARDVDCLRAALGAEQIALHGASYGSHLGLACLKQFPERIARAILFIVEGLNDTHKLPGNTDRHFRHLSDLASNQFGADCPDLYGELQAAIDPLDDNPIIIQSKDVHGVSQTIPVGRFVARTMLSAALGALPAIERLPQTARRLSGRNLGAFAGRAGRWLSGPFENVMALAMDAASGASVERLAQIESERGDALLDDVYNLPYPFIGDELGVTDLGDTFREPVTTDVPTLFVSGSLDGRTPRSNAVDAARGFVHSSHIHVTGMAHETPHLAELIDAQQQFLRGQDVPADTLSKPFRFGALDP